VSAIEHRGQAARGQRVGAARALELGAVRQRDAHEGARAINLPGLPLLSYRLLTAPQTWTSCVQVKARTPGTWMPANVGSNVERSVSWPRPSSAQRGPRDTPRARAIPGRRIDRPPWGTIQWLVSPRDSGRSRRPVFGPRVRVARVRARCRRRSPITRGEKASRADRTAAHRRPSGAPGHRITPRGGAYPKVASRPGGQGSGSRRGLARALQARSPRPARSVRRWGSYRRPPAARESRWRRPSIRLSPSRRPFRRDPRRTVAPRSRDRSR